MNLIYMRFRVGSSDGSKTTSGIPRYSYHSIGAAIATRAFFSMVAKLYCAE